MAQQGIFGGPAPPSATRTARGQVRPADVPDLVRQLAARMPSGLAMGTSSWSFPGWTGRVYADRYSAQKLAREGLAAYAQHPLLRAVGVDRSFYRPMTADTCAELAAATPPHFRFLVKAHDHCTLQRFPEHARYGDRRGQANTSFLDPTYAAERVLLPTAEGLGDRLGAVLFQFPPQAEMPPPVAFADRLHTFLQGLPPGIPVAVEVRNAALLVPALGACLRDQDAAQCLAVHPRLPDIHTQEALTGGGGGPLVMRWMLQPSLSYDVARARFAPFTHLAAPDPRRRSQIVQRVGRAMRRDRPALIIVNNKAEGSSPLSIVGLADALSGPRGR